jgi:hypothetical protein
MRLQLTSLLACPIDRLASELTRPALLQEIAAPMLTFVPVEPADFGGSWEPRQYRTRLFLGGRVPLGEHTLDIKQDATTDGALFHDAGFSDLIKTWDHRVILADFHGMTRYTDRVQIVAGLLTPVAWAFAILFYTHRQRRLNRLVASNFTYRLRQ